MKPLVSVIVPVYRAEDYLDVCIGSLLAQTYSYQEIILVDDGSPDGSPALCDELAARDERITVIHQENGGASSARNRGLELANGQYIVFVDSDDLMPPQGIEMLVEGILAAGGCDFVAGMCEMDSTGKMKHQIDENADIYFQLYPEKLMEYIVQPGSYSPYAKIFRADIIKNQNIRYDTALKCSEDALFIRTYLQYCQHIRLIPQIVYRYTTSNSNSLSKRGYPDYVRYFVKKLKAVEILLDRLPISNEMKKQFLFDRAVHGMKISVQHYFSNYAVMERKHYAELVRKELLPWLRAGISLHEIPMDYIRHFRLKRCVEDEKWMYREMCFVYACYRVKRKLKRAVRHIRG